MKVLKRAFLNFLTFPLVVRGFSKAQAKSWFRRAYADFRNYNNASLAEKIWAYRRGFTSEHVQAVGITRENYKDFISERDYRFLQPLNEKYSKWLDDKVSILNIFKPFVDVFPESYYQIYKRDDQWIFIPLSGISGMQNTNDASIDDVLALIRDKKQVAFTSTISRRKMKIQFDVGSYFINDEKISPSRLKKFILGESDGKYSILTEYIEPHPDFFDEETRKTKIMRLNVINSEGDNPIISDAFLIEKELLKMLPTGEEIKTEEVADEEKMNWIPIDMGNGENSVNNIPFNREIEKKVKALCQFVPEIELMAIDVAIAKNGFKFEWLMPILPYPKNVDFNTSSKVYLHSKIMEKRRAYASFWVRCQNTGKRIRLQIRRTFARAFFPQTLYPYLSVRWIGEVVNDFFTNKNATFKEKRWAYKHGFQSYRLAQYGITPENHLNFISDFEYKWIRHINGKYRAWFEDKITLKYILSDFKECFPGYYYHIALKNGKNKIIPMMDCPDDFGASYEDVFRLAQDKKILALKPDEGSHGEGFFKLTHGDGKYYLNDVEATEERIKDLLSNVENQYLITEYIQSHPDIKRIYPDAVNTVRLTVFKKDGKTPYIGNGYIRFGSIRTGVVDNIGAGGIGAELDVKTGRFYNAQTIENGAKLVPCEMHPDTGVKLEGYLPNWEMVKLKILEIAASVPQMEYFGFDIALTEDGIKFPEINRFPDYPRINLLTPETMDYLVYKLNKKKLLYGYFDERPPRRLANLPKR